MTLEATKNLIVESQYCQRNWDTSLSIPQDHLDLLEVAVRQCPSKQNYAFYKVKFITNRTMIEAVHNDSNPNGNGGFGVLDDDGNTVFYTNPQTLANLLVVFGYSIPLQKQATIKNVFGHHDYPFKRDADMAIGIAMGSLMYHANALGYKTGGNACWGPAINGILGEDDTFVTACMLGIGYPDPARNSREHHTDPTFTFPQRTKETIGFEVIT